MENLLSQFENYIKPQNIIFPNQYLEVLFYQFSFCFIKNKTQLYDEILRLPNKLKIIVIDEYKEGSKSYLFICFDFNMLILNVDQNSIISFLNEFVLKFDNNEIYFLQDNPIAKKNSNKIEDQYFSYELYNFSNEFMVLKNKVRMSSIRIQALVKIMFRCMSGFLIKKGYKQLKMQKHDRYFQSKEIHEKITPKKKCYITLRQLGRGYLASVDLIYYIP